eukprot:CAMPEP_0114584860 /NCGR_PEP_ID=MMETSP0125-20121206/8500_1 /TAXON_ID=485358 ORGANISM="Aristerostoma sp., Strain ATCC 50986" /NCGR_SAMPLE_ID=MMETSP0125 /ASSEMBLY_ACC=CAM_ASM_000245 /LENGTH=192 /DNA_ID=CAMNT_0001779553 /DNA_START=1146 /DNA_END=1725 /DNA_ORIENTATION=+
MVALSKRNRQDHSLEWIELFYGFGFYKSSQNPNLLQSLAANTEDPTLCEYITVDLETGDISKKLNGYFPEGFSYKSSVYYTSVIKSQSGRTQDAIFMDYQSVWITYDHVTYETNLTRPYLQPTSQTEGTFDYENGKAIIVSVSGSLLISNGIRIYEFDLNDNMTMISNKSLSSYGGIFKLDDNNIILETLNT